MKYILVSFLLLGLASCSFGKNPEENTLPNGDIGGVHISDSGVSVSSENENVSIGTNGNVLVKNASGSVTIDDTGVNVVSDHAGTRIGEDGVKTFSGKNTVSIWKDGVNVGTGVSVSSKAIDKMAKDPEVEKSTQDINSLFSDIAEEEK